MTTNEQRAQMIDGAARYSLANPRLTGQDALWGYMRQQGLRRAVYLTMTDGARRQMVRDMVRRRNELREAQDEA